jgi:predicted NUDIX family NTP pyrophosphohydrolase
VGLSRRVKNKVIFLTKLSAQDLGSIILQRFKINTVKIGEPSFLMIITGGEFAYQRNDGIWVIPIGCLKN